MNKDWTVLNGLPFCRCPNSKLSTSTKIRLPISSRWPNAHGRNWNVFWFEETVSLQTNSDTATKPGTWEHHCLQNHNWFTNAKKIMSKLIIWVGSNSEKISDHFNWALWTLNRSKIEWNKNSILKTLKI